MKKQSSIEWLIEQLHNGKELSTVIRKAKEMHMQELEATYNHAMWALVDTGHGEGFDEYYKNTYEKEN